MDNVVWKATWRRLVLFVERIAYRVRMSSQNGNGANPDNRIIRVVVVTPLGRGGRGGIDRLNDAIFQVVNARPNSDVFATQVVTRGKGGLFSAQFVFAYALLRIFLACFFGNVDLLHVHLSLGGSSYRKIIVTRAAKLARIPYVIHLHGGNYDEFWSATAPWIARGINGLFRDSALIVVLGKYWADVIINRLPEVANKIVVLPNACWSSSQPQVPSEDGRTRISVLGRLEALKGTPQFVRAVAMLRDRSDWQATIAGDGAIKETIASVKYLGVHDRVAVTGWLDSEAIDALLCRTDILALPSFCENLPMVILEAFAHGVPVVSTPIGAIPEVVLDEHNGLIVSAGDVEGLAEALRRLLSEPAFRKTLGDNARRDHQDKYDIGNYVERLVALWRQAVRAPLRESMRNGHAGNEAPIGHGPAQKTETRPST
jgi:glycosyltransferase involved in cell wall biosynthesis